MRQVLSISLPKKDVAKIKGLAKKRGYPNFSAYIAALVEADQNTISEDALLKIVAEGRKEYRAGKTIQAKSMRDLI